MKEVRTTSAFHIISEPGDGTRYDYAVMMDGPDTFCFAPIRSTFKYPDKINRWEVAHIQTVEQCAELSRAHGCNPYTFLECVRTIQEMMVD